ncbi:MAG TPA: cytochrome P450 [Streptosporangiaceae bacterium]|nr:cytochrome P450 [Streptosporangiaceae bacterium]
MTGLPPGSALPSVLQSIWWALRPLAFAETYRRRYGSLFTTRIYPFGPVVYVADPALVKEVMTAPAGKFRAGDANRVVEFLVGSRSLLLLDGPGHTASRRTLMPAFHGDSLAGYAAQIQSAASEIDSWPRDQPISLHHRLHRIALDVMIQVVLGVRDADTAAELHQLVPRLFRFDPLVILVPKLRIDLGPRSPWGRFVRVRDRVDQILYQQIAERERDPGQGSDALSLLIRASRARGGGLDQVELRDHLITLLAVGPETTATAMAWCVERLVRHPSVLARLREDMAGGGDSYLDAVIHETLRVRPVTMDIARTLAEDTDIASYRVPAGTMIVIPLGLLHSSAELYNQPREFRPERFLDAAPPAHHFLPFGGGPHRCLGASFAMEEMRALLRYMVSALDMVPVTPQPERQRSSGPTLIPALGTKVVIRDRALRAVV